MSDTRTRQIPELNVLRLLAILFVVSNHLDSSLIFGNMPHVSFATSPLLAIISGFLLFRHLEGLPDLGAKIQQRFITLAVPYLLWTFIYYVTLQGIRAGLAHVGLAGFLNNPTAEWSLQDYWSNYVVKPTPGAFWYVQDLMLILPFSFLLYPLLKIRRSLAPCLILILVGYIFKWPLYFNDRFLPYFILGAWMGLHQPEGPRLLAWKPHVLWVTALLLLVASRFLEITNSAIELVARVPVYAAICFVLFSAVRASWSTKWIVALNRKANLSFLMHASHQLLLVLLGRFVLQAFHSVHHGVPSGPLFEITAGAFLFVCCVWLVYRLDFLLRRFAPHLLSWLNGTRHRGTSSPSDGYVWQGQERWRRLFGLGYRWISGRA